MSEPEWEHCEICGREAQDVQFDFMGPDPNSMTLERWGYMCGPDMGCFAEPVAAAQSGSNGE